MGKYRRLRKETLLQSFTKIYTLSADSVTLSKVSRSTFKKKLYDYSKQRENGVTYYWGTAAKITIKGGKVVKIQQVFQS